LVQRVGFADLLPKKLNALGESSRGNLALR
jgi:hypothetical protein